MSNGIFTITLDDQAREMAANFGFVEMIEQTVIKKPVIQLLDEALSGKFHITDMVSVFFIGLKANKDTRLTREQIGTEVVKLGSANFMQTYIEMLTCSITGSTELKPSDDADKKK